MKPYTSAILFTACVLAASGDALAQAKPKAPAKSTPKTTAKTTTKPVSKTTAKPAAKPAAQPAAASTKPAAASAPAPASTPATTSGVGAEQIGPFKVGTNVVNVGIGFGTRYGYGSGYWGGSSSVSPAFSASFERGLMELGPGILGVGGIVAYQGASYNFGGGDKIKYGDMVFMLRGTYHYSFNEQFDTYGGLGLGLRHVSVSTEGAFLGAGGASGTDATMGIFVGGRYFFNPSFGAFAELGYDQTYLKAGLAVKF